MTEFFDFAVRLPCKVFTAEEIAKEYGDKATRPIPPGYEPKKNVIARLNSAGAKPFASFAVDGTGRRRFIKSHHSQQAADDHVMMLNDENTDPNVTYTASRRSSGKRRSR